VAHRRQPCSFRFRPIASTAEAARTWRISYR
jgi:hypothetical protein